MKLSYSLPINLKIRPFSFGVNLEFIYLILFAGFAALNLLSGTPLPFGLIFRVYRYIAIVGIFVIFFLKNRYSFTKASLIVIIAVVFFIVANVTQKSTLIVSGLFVAAAGITKFEKIVKTSLIATVPSLLFVIACSKVGIIPDHLFMHEGHVAHSLGFSYYSTFAYIALFCMISYLYLRGSKISWIEILTMTGLNYVVYKLSTTRLAFYIFLLVLGLFLMLIKFNMFKDINKSFYKMLAILGYPITCIITIWASLNYSVNSPMWRKINEISANRLVLSHKAFIMYSPKIFGQYIEMHGNGYGDNGAYFYIDSGYVYSVLGYGILFTGILIIAYSFMTWAACKKNDKELLLWLLAIMAFSIINNVWVNVTYNSILLAFLPMIQKLKKEESAVVKLCRKVLSIK